MKKRIIALICCFLLVFPVFAQAKVGVDVIDHAKLDLWYETDPVKETLTTTRYTPWFYVMHLPSKKHIETGKNAGEGGQMIYDISISPVNTKNMLVSIDVGGIYISDDGGENFNLADRGLPLYGLADSVWDPDDENTVYGFNSAFGSSSYINTIEKRQSSGYHGIYKSTNKGKNWVQILDCVTTQHRQKLGLSFDKKGYLYVNAYESLFRSPDKGKTWEKFGQPNKNSAKFYVHPEEGWMLRAITGEGIYRSDDNGETWISVTDGKIDGTETTMYQFAVNPNDNNMWVCIVDNSLYYTYDAGANWEIESKESYDTRRVNKPFGSVNSGASVLKIEFGAYNPNGNPCLYIDYTSTVQPFKYSHDLGKTWGTIQPTDAYDLVINEEYGGNTGYLLEGLMPDPYEPYTVWYSFCDVLYKSTDGGVTFNYSGSGMSGDRVSKFVFDDPNYAMVFPCTDKGVLRTIGEIDGIHYWENTSDRQTQRFEGAKSIGDYQTDPFDSSHVILSAGGWSKKAFSESWDHGEHFKVNENIVTTLTQFNNKRQGMIYTNNHITLDGGKTWKELEKPISAVSPSDNDVVYSMNSDTKKAYRSTDCATTWTELEGSLSSKAQTVMVDPNNPYKVYALLSSGSVDVFENNKLLKTITTANGIQSYDDKYAHTMEAMAIDPDNSDHMLLGGRNSRTAGRGLGIFESWDGGETWEVVMGMPGARDIWAFGFEKGAGKAYAATSSGTVVYEFNKYRQWKEEVLSKGFEFYINGKREKDINVMPQVDGDEIYVGIRSLFENIGHEVKWNSDEESATVVIDKKTYVLDMNDNKIYVNGKADAGDYNLHYFSDNSMISLTALREVFGFKTGWDFVTGKIGIYE